VRDFSKFSRRRFCQSALSRRISRTDYSTDDVRDVRSASRNNNIRDVTWMECSLRVVSVNSAIRD